MVPGCILRGAYLPCAFPFLLTVCHGSAFPHWILPGVHLGGGRRGGEEGGLIPAFLCWKEEGGLFFWRKGYEVYKHSLEGSAYLGDFLGQTIWDHACLSYGGPLLRGEGPWEGGDVMNIGLFATFLVTYFPTLPAVLTWILPCLVPLLIHAVPATIPFHLYLPATFMP